MSSNEEIVTMPPSEEFPEGRQVLIGGEVLKTKLNGSLTSVANSYTELKEIQRQRLLKAREALLSVPPEKRPI